MKVSQRTKFVVQGLNQERHINFLSKRVKLYSVNRKNKKLCEFEVDEYNRKTVREYLVSNGAEILSEKTYGLKSKILSIFASYGVILSIFFCLTAYLFACPYIWRVQIYGLEKIEASAIYEYVQNAVNFKKKSEIDTEDFELCLRVAFTQISSVSVAIVGQTLVVNVNEAVTLDGVTGQTSAIYAKYDCQITSISLSVGTLAVEVGDYVKAGDVLVMPYVLDSDGKLREVSPSAEILGYVWVCGEVTHQEEAIVATRTGQTETSTSVSLYGLTIYSSGEEQCSYQTYETEITEKYLCKNLILPIKVMVTTYYETQTTVVSQDFEIVRENKILEARQKALHYLASYEIIEEETYQISDVAGITNVTYYLKVERQVGVS